MQGKIIVYHCWTAAASKPVSIARRLIIAAYFFVTATYRPVLHLLSYLRLVQSIKLYLFGNSSK